MDVTQLHGAWIHSSEESEAGREVYRRATYDFPRVRGARRSLVIEPDGAVVVGSAGRTDASLRVRGSWRINGDELVISDAGRDATFEVESVDEDRLVLRSIIKGA